MKCNVMRILSLIALSLPGLVVAGEGDHGGNGGDPLLARRSQALQAEISQIRGFITNELKGTLQLYFKWLQVRPGRISHAAFAEMVRGGIEQDIIGSEYEFSENCRDLNGDAIAASARMNEKQGVICFNLRRLAEEKATHEELIGLAVHEHAHHFGFADSDYALMTSVIDSVPEFLNDRKSLESFTSLPSVVRRMPKKLVGIGPLQLELCMSPSDKSSVTSYQVLACDDFGSHCKWLNRGLRNALTAKDRCDRMQINEIPGSRLVIRVSPNANLVRFTTKLFDVRSGMIADSEVSVEVGYPRPVNPFIYYQIVNN